MNDKEIVTKAIAKVIKNGYEHFTQEDLDDINEDITDYDIDDKWHYLFIFDPDFGKAFFPPNPCSICDNQGNQNHKSHCFEIDQWHNWQYHQHQMLDEIQAGRNPLKYIEGFL